MCRHGGRAESLAVRTHTALSVSITCTASAAAAHSQTAAAQLVQRDSMLPAAHATGRGGSGGGSPSHSVSELQRLQQLGSQTARSNSTMPPPPLPRSALQLPRAPAPAPSPHSARLAAVRQSLQDNGAFGTDSHAGAPNDAQQIARWLQRSMDAAPTDGRPRDIARQVEELFFPPKPSNGAHGRSAQRLAPPMPHSLLSPLGRSSSTGWLESDGGAGGSARPAIHSSASTHSLDAANQTIHALRMEVDALRRQSQAHAQQITAFQGRFVR